MAQDTQPDQSLGVQVVGASRRFGAHQAWSFVVVLPSGSKVHMLGQPGESADAVLRRALSAVGITDDADRATQQANAAASLAAQSITLIAAGAAA